MRPLKHVLLVEDDDMDVELIRAALNENSLVEYVDVVHDGAEALDYLKCEGHFKQRPKIYPEIIIMDLKMPKINGIEVLQQLKKDAILKKIPVMILSSSREPKDLSAAQELQATKYIVKETGFKCLVDALRHYTESVNKIV